MGPLDQRHCPQASVPVRPRFNAAAVEAEKRYRQKGGRTGRLAGLEGGKAAAIVCADHNTWRSAHYRRLWAQKKRQSVAREGLAAVVFGAGDMRAPTDTSGLGTRRGHTSCMAPTDDDLESLSHAELVQEVSRLREGIRRHRDSTGHELCWHHPQLWRLLPESTDPMPEVPAWPQFMRGCIRYRQSLDDQLLSAPRISDEYDRGS